MTWTVSTALVLALGLSPLPAHLASGLQAAQQTKAEQRKPDLGDAVAGTYEGDVISDARGSSQSGVTITVKRVGKNLVEVSSDYPRVPTVTIALTKAMSAIVQARGNSVFLIDTAKDPKQLSLTIDDASLSVHRD